MQNLSETQEKTDRTEVFPEPSENTKQGCKETKNSFINKQITTFTFPDIHG